MQFSATEKKQRMFTYTAINRSFTKKLQQHRTKMSKAVIIAQRKRKLEKENKTIF